MTGRSRDILLLPVAVVLLFSTFGQNTFGQNTGGQKLRPVTPATPSLRKVTPVTIYRPVWPAEPSGFPEITTAAVVRTSATQTTGIRPSSLRPSSQPVPGKTTRSPDAASEDLFLDLTGTASASPATRIESSAIDGDLFVRLAVWTVIVLALCVLTVLGLHRWQQRRGILPPPGGRSRVLETLAVGPGRTVSLVQLGDVQAVVGTDSSGIRTIVVAPPAFENELTRFTDETSLSEN